MCGKGPGELWRLLWNLGKPKQSERPLDQPAPIDQEKKYTRHTGTTQPGFLFFCVSSYIDVDVSKGLPAYM